MGDTDAAYEAVAYSAYDHWPSRELADQCRMQARDTAQWGTEDSLRYAAFMRAVALRLEVLDPDKSAAASPLVSADRSEP